MGGLDSAQQYFDEGYEKSLMQEQVMTQAHVQNQTQGKFSMEHFPNNGWPFGSLTTSSIPALTTADIAPLTVTNLETNQTYAYKDRLMQNPTMAPITSQQVQAWSFSSDQIRSFTAADLADLSKVPAPGTIGGAKIEFK